MSLSQTSSWHSKICISLALVSLAGFFGLTVNITNAEETTQVSDFGTVKCANLIYARNKTSTCFSDAFLAEMQSETHIRTHGRFVTVRLDSMELYEYPFVVMTGEGRFKLTEKERKNMRNYLLNGGFMVVSAGCSSKEWNRSIQNELELIFGELKTQKLPAKHPVFHTVYDITTSRYKKGSSRLPTLEGLEVDGKIVLIWSPDGLNDTKNAGGKCCCCGGNEVKAAKKININLLAYALTH